MTQGVFDQNPFSVVTGAGARGRVRFCNKIGRPVGMDDSTLLRVDTTQLALGAMVMVAAEEVVPGSYS